MDIEDIKMSNEEKEMSDKKYGLQNDIILK